MYTEKISAYIPILADSKSKCMANRRTACKVCWMNKIKEVESKAMEVIQEQKEKIKEEIKWLEEKTFHNMTPKDIMM